MNEIVTPEMEQIRTMIVETVAKREFLKKQMKDWYENNPNKKFHEFKDLIVIDSVLSELDSHYKRLWDINNTQKDISA
jgi:hypothetical protein